MSRKVKTIYREFRNYNIKWLLNGPDENLSVHYRLSLNPIFFKMGIWYEQIIV